MHGVYAMQLIYTAWCNINSSSLPPLSIGGIILTIETFTRANLIGLSNINNEYHDLS